MAAVCWRTTYVCPPAHFSMQYIGKSLNFELSKAFMSQKPLLSDIKFGRKVNAIFYNISKVWNCSS